jgi:DNA polymerase (family 10)
MNIEIANIFYQIADILEIKGDKFRPQAYRVAAQSLEALKKDVQDIYLEKGEKGLKDIPGIGEALSQKIIQYIETEKIDKLERLKKEIPAGIYEMMSIPGVGAKRAKLFYDSGIKDIKELEKAARNHKLQKLPSFKQRAEEKILEGIKSMGIEERLPRKEAEKIASKILQELEAIKEIKKIEIAGSLRRKKESIRDFDFVILTDNPEKVIEKITKMSFVKDIIAKGKEKLTIITKQDRQADFRFFNKEEYGAGLLYFTGDKGHNIWLRTIAIKKGLKLNEYGLFKNEKRIAGKTEEEIYDKLGLKYISPEKRVGEVI